MDDYTSSSKVEPTNEFLVINDLGPSRKGIKIKFKCISKYKERTVFSKHDGRTFRVAEALVGDSTACILLTLWNKDIEKIQPDGEYQLSNGYTSIFRGSLRLNIGKHGNLEAIDENLGEIKKDKNLSNLIFEQDRKPQKRKTREQKKEFRPFRGYLRRY